MYMYVCMYMYVYVLKLIVFYATVGDQSMEPLSHAISVGAVRLNTLKTLLKSSLRVLFWATRHLPRITAPTS